MKAKRLATIMTSYNDNWEKLSDEYQYFDLDSFVARARIIAPEIFYESPEIEEIEGEVQDENEHYILTWEDGMDEVMWIYEKI